MVIKKIKRFIDKLESRVRGKLSNYPIFYALIGGIGVIIFWRGLWHFADDLNVSSISSIIIGAIILLLTGLFIPSFLGSRFILSGLIGEKKLAEEEEGEIETEESQIRNLQNTLNRVEKKLEELEKEVEEK